MAGDYADEHLDAMFDEWERDEDYDEDRWENGYTPHTPRRDLVCPRCKATHLRWAETEDGWKVSDDGYEAHECPPGDLDAFEVIE